MATGIGKDNLTERAMSEGADYYLVKPFSMETATERLEELLQEKESPPGDGVCGGEEEADDGRGEDQRHIYGDRDTARTIKGYKYLREGIKTTVSKPYMINNVTKGLYPSIAEKYGSTASQSGEGDRHLR